MGTSTRVRVNTDRRSWWINDRPTNQIYREISFRVMLEPKANERERLCARPPPFHDSLHGNDGERMRDLTKYLTGLLLLRFGKGYRKSGSDYLRICSSVVLGKARMDVEIRKVSFVSLVVYLLIVSFSFLLGNFNAVKME